MNAALVKVYTVNTYQIRKFLLNVTVNQQSTKMAPTFYMKQYEKSICVIDIFAFWLCQTILFLAYDIQSP